MEAFDSIFQNIASSGFRSFITLTIFVILGACSGALMTFIKRGERWKVGLV